MTRHICLWSGPRNVSTALMYSFGQRTDTRIIDEPLYGHYLRVSAANHPGRDEVLSAMDTNGDRVMQKLITQQHDRPVLFMKQMAHHLTGLDLSFLEKTINILLVRDPEEMLPSLTVQLPNADISDTGLATQCNLVERLNNLGQYPVVLDSKELLINPGVVLDQLCHRLDLEFDENMLCWPRGAREEDGIWARHWYHGVHESTGFAPYRPKTEPFPERLVPLLEQCRPFYEQLKKLAIKAYPANGDD